MPNWCTNWIEIEGDKKTISKLTRIIKDASKPENKTGLFETLIGIKPNVAREDYDNGHWYNANTEWFGTKWDVDVCESNFNLSDESISFSCETAWSPPCAFLATFCAMYGVSAVITYEEAGSDFAGRTSFDEGGDIVEEEDYRYEEGIYVLQNDYFWENLDSNFEYYADSEMTAEEVRDHYGFVSDEDKAEIIKMYEEYLKENEITFESSNNG